MSEEYILEAKGITKKFGSVTALKRVDLKIKRGEVHVLCGENGAGKSTLMNIISGIYPYGSYEGQLFYDGTECRFEGIRASESKGIAIIHQQLALIPRLSIAENIYAGNEMQKRGVINWDLTNSKAKEVMERVGLLDDPETLVQNIGVGKQQLVEICKAISKDVKLLILDEPTAALTDEESDKLLNLIKVFQAEGITSILITHKLREISRVCNALTVLRDGETIDTWYEGKDEITEDRIVKAMVGREMTNRFPERTPKIGEVRFEIKNWNVFSPIDESKQILKNINMHVRQGEVLGIAGLMGAGRTELAMSIFGKSYGTKISGELYLDGKKITINNVSDAIKNKIAYVSEDRHAFGLVGSTSITKNITLPSLKNFVHGLAINADEETVAANKCKDMIHIKCRDVDQAVSNLSGGNQQKVIISKWVLCDSDILILDEPTRGIDVGAKYEIYEIINELVASGKSVIMISSDMPEILGMCDRMYVLNEGEVIGELEGDEITQVNTMKIIMSRGA